MKMNNDQGMTQNFGNLTLSGTSAHAVVVAGDIDLTCDQHGLALASQLGEALERMLPRESSSKPAKAAIPTPFANEEEALEVGPMTVENRVDRITISFDGSVNLIGSEVGTALKNIVADVSDALHRRDQRGILPDTIEIKPQTPAGNLFGLNKPTP